MTNTCQTMNCQHNYKSCSGCQWTGVHFYHYLNLDLLLDDHMQWVSVLVELEGKNVQELVKYTKPYWTKTCTFVPDTSKIYKMTKKWTNHIHTWRQSRAGSRIFKFFVSNASRRGFKTSSASAPSKAFPAFAKTVEIVPLKLTGPPTGPASWAICGTVSAWFCSVSAFVAPATVSCELQTKVNPKNKLEDIQVC